MERGQVKKAMTGLRSSDGSCALSKTNEYDYEYLRTSQDKMAVSSHVRNVLKACAVLFLVGLGASASTTARTACSAPTATVKNGTYIGKHVASYNQDLFLGIPFAQPPVGDLRLQNPQPLNTTFDHRLAVNYAASCVGYGNSDAWPFTLSEDCLTLNVVKPSGFQRKKDEPGLPVGVFIHGGGWTMDYSANGVYNLSFMVQESVDMGKPIVAVSFDYRLSAWGFLASPEIVDAGVANLGLKDQRLALHWVRENIAAFGGDPDKVVIFGESAGGGNVWYQTTAYGGRDDRLFRGLISESGAEGSHPNNLTLPTERYDNITRFVGCNTASDKLACLRSVPFETINDAITNLTSTSFYPVVDGDFLPESASKLLDEGRFVQVPMVAGTNADEGTLFAGATPYETDEDIVSSIQNSGLYNGTSIGILLDLYPNIDALGLPAGFRMPANTSALGAQYKRAIALLTDQLFLVPRRRRSDAWSRYGVPNYAYLFESPLTHQPSMGTSHFAEIAYVFHNTINLGYEASIAPFVNATQPMLDLATLTCRSWVSFIHDLDPNHHGIANVAQWPLYNATGGYGEAFYFHPSDAGVVADTFRLASTTFINTIGPEQYGV